MEKRVREFRCDNLKPHEAHESRLNSWGGVTWETILCCPGLGSDTTFPPFRYPPAIQHAMGNAACVAEGRLDLAKRDRRHVGFENMVKFAYHQGRADALNWVLGLSQKGEPKVIKEAEEFK